MPLLLRNFLISTLLITAFLFYGEYQQQGEYLFADPIGMLLSVYLALGVAISAIGFAVFFLYRAVTRRIRTPSSR